ncbi:heme o synthase [Salinirussus salinus]|uniref:heme o synthase n=1 Tax=Salinirussus salinus TaxID=1198300 RepID=UPI001358330D|nr:heme o synthase [Salinirussus salinus]
MTGTRWRPRPATLYAAAVAGVYLLVVAGATAGIADAARACQSWPLCAGDLSAPTVLVAVGHRALAALVGVAVLAAGLTALRDDSRRVRLAGAAGLALYPVQVGIGAWVAVSGGALPLPGLHLLVGMSIFAAFLFALAWRLEAETGGDDDPVGPASAPPSGLGSAESAPEPTPSAAPDLSLSDRLYAYFRLMKPRLMWLLALVAAAAMALAAGPDGLSARTIVLTLGGGVLAIGASGTFNHVLERDRDRRMSRTDDRPTVTQAIPVRNAVAFGGLLVALSLGLFLQVNLLAALLGLTAILFYSVVYTLLLKPNTVQNTVIGGAAGALPALIGWAAVTGEVGLPGLLLAGLIFVWTPAHFYNLALAYKDDYARGGFPMMPVVRGETATRKHILLWAGLTLVAAAALIWLTPLGWLSAAASTAVGAVFVWAVVRLHREQTEAAAFRAFHASNAYLGTVLLAIVVDGLVL